MKYKAGYKYQLVELEYHFSKIKGFRCEGRFYDIFPDGRIVALPGYAWDGATNFPDVKSIRRASLFHDIGFQATREGKLPRNKEMFNALNDMLTDICREDKMSYVLSRAVHWGVTEFSYFATDPKNDNPVLTAP